MTDQPQEAVRSAGGGSLKAFGMTVTRVERERTFKEGDGRQAVITFDDGTPEGIDFRARLSGCAIAAGLDLRIEAAYGTNRAFERAAKFFGKDMSAEPAGDAKAVCAMVCEALEV